MALIPAITIWQPWASLIAIGAKPHEFRTWEPPKHFVGQRVAIHAGGKAIDSNELREIAYQLDRREPNELGLDPDLALPLLREALALPAALPRSAIVCTAILGQPRRCSTIFRHGNPDKFGWPMGQVRRLDPPVPAKGRQGWWFAKVPAEAEGQKS